MRIFCIIKNVHKRKLCSYMFCLLYLYSGSDTILKKTGFWVINFENLGIRILNNFILGTETKTYFM